MRHQWWRGIPRKSKLEWDPNAVFSTRRSSTSLFFTISPGHSYAVFNYPLTNSSTPIRALLVRVFTEKVRPWFRAACTAARPVASLFASRGGPPGSPATLDVPPVSGGVELVAEFAEGSLVVPVARNGGRAGVPLEGAFVPSGAAFT